VLFVATIPLFLRNDASDANNVPPLLWLFAALVLFEEYLAAPSARGALACSALLGTLAAISRPELAGLVPVTFLLVAWASVSLGQFARYRLVRAWLGVSALLLLPHLLFITGQVGALQGRESLPGFSLERLRSIPHLLVHTNTL